MVEKNSGKADLDSKWGVSHVYVRNLKSVMEERYTIGNFSANEHAQVAAQMSKSEEEKTRPRRDGRHSWCSKYH